MSRLPGPARAALAPLAGVFLALAHPRPGWGLLVVPGAALFLALAVTAPPRRALAEGWLAGAVFFGLLLRWFGFVLLVYTPLPGGTVLAAVLLSGALEGVGTGVLAWTLARLARRASPGLALVAAPFLWIALEWSREAFPFPFPWGSVGVALAAVPGGLSIARLAGGAGLGFLGVSWAALLAAPLVGARPPRRLVTVLAAVTSLVGCASVLLPGPGGREVTVAVVQGSVPEERGALARLATYEELAREAAVRGADLVVWPESAVPWRIDGAPGFRARVEALARDLGIDLVLGSVTAAPEGGRYNSAVLVRADEGVAGIAPKRRLVPFGEYLPLRALLGDIPAIAAEAGDFVPGREQVLLESRVGPLGPLVCYELVFPGISLGLARAGADLLVNLTNDTWFGDSSGPLQHAAHARLRAAETGRPLLRAANSGISLLVDGRGRVLGRLGTGERGVLVARVRTGTGPPVGGLVSRALEFACATLAAVALLLAAIPGRGPRWRADVAPLPGNDKDGTDDA